MITDDNATISPLFFTYICTYVGTMYPSGFSAQTTEQDTDS